jgi:hypothetical protein
VIVPAAAWKVKQSALSGLVSTPDLVDGLVTRVADAEVGLSPWSSCAGPGAVQASIRGPGPASCRPGGGGGLGQAGRHDVRSAQLKAGSHRQVAEVAADDGKVVLGLAGPAGVVALAELADGPAGWRRRASG